MALPAPPPDFPRDVYRARRAAMLARNLPSAFFAGSALPRNYEANRHPFRASSHFLHFVGHPIEGAVLVLADEATLFVPMPLTDDTMWHGPSVSLESLGESLGIEVRSIERLTLSSTTHAFIPSFDERVANCQVALAGGTPDAAAIEALADALVALRLRHDAHALGELRRAASVAELAHRAGMALARPGRRVSEVRAMMEAVITAHGMTTAYGSIVTPHGEILHAGPSSEVLLHDDTILADVGAESPYGYASDLTRTYPANGRFEPEARDLYEAVLRTQRAVIEAARAETRYRSLHELAMRSLGESLIALGLLDGDPEERAFDGSVALFFPHGVGHLLGLDVHDMEDLGDRAGYASGRLRAVEPSLRYLRLDRDLEADMVVTIEPGIYFVPAFIDVPDVRACFADRVNWARVDAMRRVRGIRIEDDVHVTSSEPIVLTRRAPKRVFGIESVVGSGVDWDRLVAKSDGGFSPLGEDD